MDKRILIGSGVLIVLIVAVFLFYGGEDIVSDFEQSGATAEVGVIIEGGVVEFNIEAFRFGYSPDIIRVKQGDNVRLVIDNLDTLHGIRIPDLGVSGDDVLEFVVDEKGEFVWYCNNFCGGGHSGMSGTLIVE
jgi:cytochrome c oxidase subunit 2